MWLSTPSTGEFEVPVDANSTMTYWAEKGGVKSEVVGPGPTCENGAVKDIGDIVLAAPVATITLTWGANPSDLDGHLAVPINGGWEHVYYPDAGEVVEGVKLDTDDISSYGPEIFRIFELHEGTYRYCVHHFGGSETISTSGAQVNLIVDGLGIFTFTPPPGAVESKDVWRVFDLESQAGAITDVITINDLLNNVSASDDSSFTP